MLMGRPIHSMTTMQPKPDWVMPEPPVPGAVPGYYLDDGFALYWLVKHSDGEFDEWYCADHPAAGDIRWPFDDDAYATRADLEALGFVDAESL